MEEEIDALTEEDFKEFLSAKTYEEQLKIVLKHSEKNQKGIESERKKENLQAKGDKDQRKQ